VSVPSDPAGLKLVASLRDHAPRLPGMETHLDAAITQAVCSPGSLQRARLVEAAARHHGLGDGTAAQLACAVEYFHAASLLFDDLPCMDDASMRRGRPCVHRLHGEATAILAALALINRAHVLVGFAYAAYPAAVRLQAALCVDDSLGVGGLVGGQARDLRFGEGDTSRREIGRIAAAKTGALYRLALVLPALAVRPGPDEFRLLKALALYWGQWFQACDDMKDVLATPTQAGKDTGRDRALLRPNLVLAIGPAAARRRIARLEAQITRTGQRLKQRGPQWAYLEHCQGVLFEKGRVRAA
jgi:geranylgeranyl diphosphate synthase type II